MKKQQGFTLIELVVVIVILGILAVTAAPRFLDMQGEAREGTLNGLKAALESANTMVYSKAAIAGVESTDDTTVDSIDIKYGYIDATATAFEAVMNLSISTTSTDDVDWYAVETDGGSSASSIEVWPMSDGTFTSGTCSLEYTEADASDDYSVTVNEC